MVADGVALNSSLVWKVTVMVLPSLAYPAFPSVAKVVEVTVGGVSSTSVMATVTAAVAD